MWRTTIHPARHVQLRETPHDPSDGLFAAISRADGVKSREFMRRRDRCKHLDCTRCGGIGVVRHGGRPPAMPCPEVACACETCQSWATWANREVSAGR